MVQKNDTALLASAFAKVANNEKHWNQWIVADVWATLINQTLQLPDEMKVTGSYISLSLLRSAKYKSVKDVVDIYHEPNIFGLFRSKIAKVTAFYVTATNSCPKLNNHMPGRSTQFVRHIIATIETRSHTATANLPSTTASTPPPPPAEEAEQQECRPRKKARRWMSLPSKEEPQQRGRFHDGQFGDTSSFRKRKSAPDTTTTESTTTESTTTESTTPPPPTSLAALEIVNQEYSDSPEAKACLV